MSLRHVHGWGRAVAATVLVAAGGQVWAQSPPQTTVVDSACAARCRSDYDRAVASAAAKLKERKYYQGLASGNCPTPWNMTENACSTAFLACDGKCGLYDVACRRACTDAFQPCCHANEVLNAEHYRERCLGDCPKVAAPGPVGVLEKLESPRSKEAAAMRVNLAPFGPVREAAWEELQATKTAAERTSDNERRQAVFRQAHADLSRMNGKFVVVSGGGGRLWIVRADGTAVKIPANLAGALRAGLGSDEAAVARTVAGLSAGMGLDANDARRLVDTVVQWKTNMLTDFGEGFAPGQALYFPGGTGWPEQVMRAHGSSEHATIRGSINGGGDFI